MRKSKAIEKEKTIVEEVADTFGGRKKLADMLDVTVQAVQAWINDGFFPPTQAVRLERIRNGEIRAVDLAPPTPQDDGKE